MFSLKDFIKLQRKIKIFGSISFVFVLFFAVFVIFSIVTLFDININRGNEKIIEIFCNLSLSIVFGFLWYRLVEKKLYANFLKKHSDIVSYIVLQEFTDDKKYSVSKNFSSAEIENFINQLDCVKYAKFNEIPTDYFYTKNSRYLILKFENEFLQHYTRKINWEDLWWDYRFNNNKEYLSIEYFDKERKETIKEEIITERIKQNPFHIYILFVIYALKYGKKIAPFQEKKHKKNSDGNFFALLNTRFNY